MQTKPNRWDKLKWSVYWAFRLSEVFILIEYVHVRIKKVSVPKAFRLLGVRFTEFKLY